MFEELKEKFTKNPTKQKKEKKVTKQQLTVLVTLGLLMFTGMGIMSYEPGSVSFHQQKESNKKVKVGEYSKLAGPKQTVEIQDDNQYKRSTLQKKLTPNLPKAPQPAMNLDGFLNNKKLPTTLPSFSTTPTLPTNNKPEVADNSMVYAKHASITDGMKGLLHPDFNLTSFSDAPTNKFTGRFNTTFVYSNKGNSLEKFELMSIVRTPRMDSIKTAKDALNALVEENESVNIIEDNNDYLIYDFAGSRGYQIGKIEVDDQGIYILGYINLTTNDMPYSLKMDWAEKMKKL